MKKENLQEKEINNNFYYFYELKERIQKTIETNKDLIVKYNVLIDIVNESNRADELPEGFIKDFEDAITNINEKIKIFEHKLLVINTLFDKYEKSKKEVREIVDLVLDALNLNDK